MTITRAGVVQSCVNCEYLNSFQGDYVAGSPKRCLRFPPAGAVEKGRPAFPIIGSADWCGEWKKVVATAEDPPARAADAPGKAR